MKYAIIDQSGNVVNAVELDPSALLQTIKTNDDGEEITLPPAWSPPADHIAVAHDSASVGWSYKDGSFVAPTPVAAPVIPAEQQIVALEAQSLMPRALREIILKDTTNPAYAKVKALDDEISALRSQIVKG